MRTVRLEDVLEVLLEKQRLWGARVIEYPISMLQRRFRLGYTPTTKLVDELEQRGFVRRMSETAVQLMFDPEPNSGQEVGTKLKNDQTSAR